MKQEPKLTAHGCAIYRGEFQAASTFIDETGTALPGDADIELAKTICKAVNEYDALCEIAEAAMQIQYANRTDGLHHALSTLAAIRKGAQ